MTPASDETRSSSRRRGRPGYDLASLVDASVEVFTERGFEGTSMETLSHHLGIGKSAIYHHVSSKDELLGLALDIALDRLEAVVETTRRLDADPVERLRHLIFSSVEVLIHERPYVTLLLRVRGNTEVEREAMARRKKLDRYVAELLTEASDAGLLRPGLDPRLVARLLFGVVNSLTEWVRPRRDAHDVADAICLLTFHGLLLPDRSENAARLRGLSHPGSSRGVAG